MIRRPKDDDIPEFKRIANAYNNNPLVSSFETGAVIEENKKIQGFGFTRTILEAIMYAESRRDKVITYNKLLEVAEIDARSMGFDQIYAFVDESFSKILLKRGWKLAKGICIIKEL